MVAPQQAREVRTAQLSAQERERILKPYLPKTNQGATHQQRHKQRIRPVIRRTIHSLLFAIIHLIFSIYIRIRQAYHAVLGQLLAVLYYHHRTPELIKRDVSGLTKVPKHLSLILDRRESLLDDVCESAAWSACAGVSMLSIYEKTGILKHSLPHLHRRIERTMTSYYGNSPNKPSISLRAPHLPSYSPPTSPDPSINGHDGVSSQRPHLTILLIDASDGRQTLVDLTKTLAEMSQHGKLSPSDISSKLIDAEITESVMGEPDLLILFGAKIVLEGYPPWQARLTEIYHVQDHAGGVGYHVFLRALRKYGQAEFRVGR
ncbi:uncharacterized protein LTR77_001448 [Saxophila tyrrhenica]|uniref:ditrans,polycis-polyprenyl diphosphate synthase [(2E,6E)-farnesyldiphosphate specific] n=1 Tax=Saxophila tyrrhenica TaxID=1690608 RepID=A0AAV9PMS8_9PEZI|nr:hypothetical protein LTR77_001448 [Saxophila tyrrhenica]